MKTILCLTVCFVLLGLPLASAITNPGEINQKQSVKNTKQIEISAENEKNDYQTTDDPPDWANGNFSGEWGFSIWGEWNIPLGWMFGYYKRSTNFGFFYAGLIEFGHENISWYLKGFIFGPFMFGSIGENQSANQTLFVGIGRYNDSSYHWRVMGEVGPTFFMDGTYTKFE